MENPLATRVDRRGGFKRVDSAPGRLAADKSNAFIVDEVIKTTDGVGTAADAGDDASGSRPSFSRICALISREITA